MRLSDFQWFDFKRANVLGGKLTLQRRSDVYKLETELAEEPIDCISSDNTLNISRESPRINAKNSKFTAVTSPVLRPFPFCSNNGKI